MPDKKTILVVDDAPENIDVLAGLLKQTYRVKVAKSGEKALVIVQKNPPDAILLDVVMPEMDGFEVCRRLKADPETAKTPIIFCSGLVDDAERQQGLALGAKGFIHKPIDPNQVLNALDEAIAD